MKLNKDGSPRKSGSGRTKGATSLVSIRLKDLAERFKDEDMIVVGRVFARESSLGETFKKISHPNPTDGVVLTVNQ